LNFFLMNNLIIPSLRCLGVLAGRIYAHTTNVNWNLDPRSVSSLATVLFIKVIVVFMFPLIVSTYLGMSCLMSMFFLFPNYLCPPLSPRICIHPPLLLINLKMSYSPVLLPNHGAGIGRGARLELLDAASPSSPPLEHVDHAAPASPVVASPACSSPLMTLSPLVSCAVRRLRDACVFISCLALAIVYAARGRTVYALCDTRLRVAYAARLQRVV
jgi:hypothetical protein